MGVAIGEEGDESQDSCGMTPSLIFFLGLLGLFGRGVKVKIFPLVWSFHSLILGLS